MTTDEAREKKFPIHQTDIETKIRYPIVIWRDLETGGDGSIPNLNGCKYRADLDFVAMRNSYLAFYVNATESVLTGGVEDGERVHIR